ncbi:MAG: hypothetical protein JNM25_06220 [Planctomycetes bacterium]|nr:hypothetical protein [Planctomycetota bacterium]
MIELVDLLPEAYRQRTARRRANRDLVLMAIPVLLALGATDLLLRARVRGVQRMAAQAHANADDGEERAAKSKQLSELATRLQAEIEAASVPMAASRMTGLLDALLTNRPAGVRFQELLCQQDPWSAERLPVIQLRATCGTASEFTHYLTALRTNEHLPPMRCERSDIRAGTGEFTFHLQTDTSTKLVPAGAPR